MYTAAELKHAMYAMCIIGYLHIDPIQLQ